MSGRKIAPSNTPATASTPQEIKAVINRLEAYSAANLYESNKAIM